MIPHQQAGYTKATLSLLLMLQRLAKWEETIYEFIRPTAIRPAAIIALGEDEAPLVE